MSKQTVIRSTIYLIIISIIAKVLSFLVRIMLARTLSDQAMNYYTLASPTMVFVITAAQMGIPLALSKVIAQSNDHKKPLRSCILLSVINNLFVTTLFIMILPFLARYVLKQEVTLPILYAIVPMIPLVTISGILKGYLSGIQKHVSASTSQIFEESFRIVFLLVMFYRHPQMDAISMAKIAMLSISAGEFGSSLFMLFALRIKKRFLLTIPSLFTHLHRNEFDEVLRISIPMTGSRIIGSLTYFLEPIVMIIGLSVLQSERMVNVYGQIHGYVLPIITMPSFLTVTLSNFLLPSFTYHYTRKHMRTARKLFNIIIGCCFLVGIGCSFLCYFFNKELLQLFYHNTRGALLMKQLAWPFALFALQPPLSSMLHALSLSKKTMWDSFLGSFTRILCIALLAPHIIQNALPIALIAGMLVTTLLHAIHLAKAFQSSFTNSPV